MADQTKKPLILLTNDDGIHAPGIAALYHAVKHLGDVCVVAPHKERSAVGHAITLTTPIRVDEVNFHNGTIAYACSGTPADCVKLAVKEICPRKPDIVLSGINPGANTGLYVLYSGTVSAAAEGMILGMDAIAFSLDTWNQPDFSYSSQIAAGLTESVLQNGLPDGTLLNVNIPAVSNDQIKGIQLSRHGQTIYSEDFEKRRDPRNRIYYWMKGKKVQMRENNDCDNEVLQNNYVSVTPIRFELTDERHFGNFQNWDIFNKENMS